MKKNFAFLGLTALLLWAANSRLGAAGFSSEVVRNDCYFRESLAAIRDWEANLAAWEKSTPATARVMRFPVPRNGDSVVWPNPIPLLLLPTEDQKPGLSLYMAEGKIQVSRPGLSASKVSTVDPGQPVAGYWHPGGGAKDHWYHRYDRRFDAMGIFQPVPAPFVLRIPAPLDWRRGTNALPLVMSNITAAPMEMRVSLAHYLTGQTILLTDHKLTLNPGSEQELHCPVELAGEGGTLLILTLQAHDELFRIPLLTHVECVRQVLRSLGQIQADSPHRQDSEAIAELNQRVKDWSAQKPSAGAEWRNLFETASGWREKWLLSRLDFDTLLFAKRKPYDSEQPYMDAHHLRNPPGGSINRLSPVAPEGRVTPVVDSLGEGIYRDLCLRWDASRLLFSFGNGSDAWDGSQSYHLYEVAPDGRELRQLTQGPKNDCEPFYLPNGQVGFTSDRSEHFVMCGAARHVANLFAMESDGSGMQQLSFNTVNDFNPALLPDGRIIYSRWEYNERSVTSLHHPFTLYPDGTHMMPYYGNATIRPNVVMFTRPVPESAKVMALFTAHHGQTHGPIGLIDRNVARDGLKAIRLLTPNIPVTGEKAEDSQFGWYSDPTPLSEAAYLCSYTPTVVPWLPRSWAIYTGDQHGNLALVYRDPAISCAEPVPLLRRPMPQVLPRVPTAADSTHGQATILITDIHEGLPGVARGEPRFLRIIEDLPRKGVHDGGVVLTSGSGIYTVKRIVGTVPIDPDGSVHFTVPANRNIYFEVLDKNQLEIQRMRSVVCFKPGENRTCVGCHESPVAAPPNRSFTAVRRAPSAVTPPPWGDAVFSFLRDLQPVLNNRCVACHTHDRQQNAVILTDDLTDRFTVGYEELLPYLKVANAMRWDNPEDVDPQPPYTYGSKVSPLLQTLANGHHGLKLSPEEHLRLVQWIDANGVYYDRYESVYGDSRSLFGGSTGKKARAVYAKRCVACHGESDGSHATWWLSLNRRDASRSRSLLAPLAKSAGGWGRCSPEVFGSASDADYQALRAVLVSLGNQLKERPREDLASLRGDAAERQSVTYPEPPAPVAAGMDPSDPEGWVYISNLPWLKARAGWSANGDALPRRDHDAENHPLRIGARVYRKGIGTHADSEIIYSLNGAYEKFHAIIAATESGGSALFQVFADDQLVFDSGLMRGLRGSKTVDVSVANAKTLRLIVSNAGDGINADMAAWADARLRRTKPTAASL